jgi:radical SAM protein with 4Fe4S-binding SPASM domain
MRRVREISIPLQAEYVGRPASVMIELTNECQLACITCPRDKKDAHDYEIGRMTFETFRRVFSEFENSIGTLDLTGLGESLIHPEIFDIIDWVRSRKNVHIYLTTNTILLSERTLDRFAAHPVDTLCISIDGTNQDEFTSVRGQLHFERLKSRVRRTVDRLSPVMEFIMCVVLVEQNVSSMLRFVELAADLGIRQLSLKPINLVANATPAAYYDQFRTQQFEQLTDGAQQAGRDLGVEVRVFQIGGHQCTFPWDPIYITWDGHFVPCCAKPFPKRMSFGNILSSPFDSVKNSPKAIQFRKELLSDEPPSFCNKCHIMEKTLYRE